MNGYSCHLDAVVAVIEHAHEIPSEAVRLCVHGLVPCSADDLLRPQQPHCISMQLRFMPTTASAQRPSPKT